MEEVRKQRFILFKGKTINGKWVEGAYFNMHHEDERTHIHHFIIPEDTPIPKDKKIGDIQVEVIDGSVCLYTGKRDRNGIRIFEGDLVKVCIPEYMSQNGFFLESENHDYIGEVIWDEVSCRNKVLFHMKGCGICGTEFGWGSTEFEVVGNIYDNPELLTTVRPKFE